MRLRVNFSVKFHILRTFIQETTDGDVVKTTIRTRSSAVRTQRDCILLSRLDNWKNNCHISVSAKEKKEERVYLVLA